MSLRRFVLCLRLKSENLRQYSTRNVLKLSERGMYQDLFPNTAANDIIKLLNKSPQCVYAGFDPTADSLHVGHLLVLVNLLHWQRGGHKVIALVGGATGHIGDPSGRNTERPELQSDFIDENIKGISKNIETVFRNHEKHFSDKKVKMQPLILLNNADWYKKMSAIDFVSKVGRHFRMGTMLLKQSVESRINSSVGMSFTEFTYQIFQSYDWLHLLDKYECNFQIGGSDQMGNLTAGHELISRVAKKEVYGLTLPLITTEEGDKFGKSAGNALWLDAAKTSPFTLYQYFIRTKDSEVEKFLKLLTFYSLGEVRDIMNKHKDHPEERYPQRCLADQITTLVHGVKGLKKAEIATQALYSKDIETLLELNSSELMEIFEGAPVVNVLLEPGLTVLDLAMKAKCFPTLNDATRIINAGGFYINHQRCSKLEEVLTESAHILPNRLSLIRVGKRNHYIVKWLG